MTQPKNIRAVAGLEVKLESCSPVGWGGVVVVVVVVVLVVEHVTTMSNSSASWSCVELSYVGF